ncbi:MAG: SpvB/TcaC N-terminal domain-containing protein [Kofleriaceae bacterium]
MRSILVVSLLVAGCRAGSVADEPIVLAKVSPISVSTDGAWSLFDRSTGSRFEPTTTPVIALFDRVEDLAAIKVFGPATGSLRVYGPGHVPLGIEVDLSRLGAGWHTLALPEVVSTSLLEIDVGATTGTSIPEIEIWALDDRDARTTVTSTSVDRVEVLPDRCTELSVKLAHRPEGLWRAYLEYQLTGALQSFSVERSINGRAQYGGAWMPSSAPHAVREQIDPDVLRVGDNDVTLCLPGDAEKGATIENLRIVGDLDRGRVPVDQLRVGTSRIDELGKEGLDVPAGGTVTIDLPRLVSPDAIVLDAETATPSEVGCLDHTGVRSTLVARAQRIDRSLAVQFGGGAASCRSIAMTFGSATHIATLDVVGSGTHERVDWPRLVVTSAREHFGDVAWVGGFVARPHAMTSAIRVSLDETPNASLTGEFGGLLKREGRATWTVRVEGRFPDGTSSTTDVALDVDRSVERSDPTTKTSTNVAVTAQAAQFGREGEQTLVRAERDAPTKIRLGSAIGIDIAPGALAKATDVSIRHLGDDRVPPLDDGLINVTGPKGHAYEFLPHGQRFARAVEVIIPYDPSLIPEGMSVDDVHTYFFDEKIRKWQKLPRTALDVGQRIARSSTDHFTIMINAVLAVPKNPTPLSIDPTALSSIAAASPGANIDLIDAPSATSTGDARTSLPIRLPGGRGAFSPSLAVSYGSASGNGWMGLGWDLSISKIEIDTRWGTPTYFPPGDPRAKEPRYLLDGDAIVPTDETDGPVCASGVRGRRFRPRIEGGFAHIQRCGSSPSNYTWEVRDREGTRFVYGGAGANLASYDDGGIFRFALREVVDVHGNTTTFLYAADVDNDGEPARELYPASITYTSHPSLPATYIVELDLDDGTRLDPISSGRAGFQIVTKRLLRGIRVRHGSNLIRQYVFTYETGQFGKTLLARAQVFGTAGCAASTNAFSVPSCASSLFHEHRFEYGQEDEGFEDTIAKSIDASFDVASQPLHAGFTDLASGGLGISAQITDDISAGVSFGLTTGGRDELVGTYDMNGDGLPDQVYADGDQVYALYNQWRPGTNPFTLFAPSTGSLVGLSAMGHERRFAWNVGANIGAGPVGVSGTYRSEATSASRFLTDANGDGFVDYLRAGGALLGQPSGADMVFTDAPFDATAAIDPRRDPLLGGIANDLSSRLVLGDPVTRWVAPFTGHVVVTGTVRKVNAGGVDGFAVDLVHQDSLLYSETFAPADTTERLLSSTGVDVVAGESLYLRLRTGADDGIAADGTFTDLADARWSVTYDEVCDPTCAPIADPTAAREPSGAPIYSFDSREDFRLAGSPAYVIVPASGTLRLRARLGKTASVADLRACVQRFPAVTPSFVPDLDAPCNATGTDATNLSGTIALGAATSTTQDIDLTFPVIVGQTLIVRVESDFSFDPANVSLAPVFGQPFLAYDEVCRLDNSAATDVVCTMDPTVIAKVRLPDDLGPSHAIVPAPTRPLVASQAGVLLFNPILLGNDALVSVRSDRQGLLEQVDCRVASCNPLVLSATTVTAGESVSIEVVRFGFTFVPPTVSGVYAGGPAFSARVHSRFDGSTSFDGTAFVGGYRGFFATIWNEAKPLAPASLLSAYQTIFLLTDDALEELVRTAIPPTARFASGPPANAPAWVGTSSAAFVSAQAMHAGVLGLYDASQEPGERGGLTHKYLRLSATTSLGFGLNLQLLPDPFGLGLEMSAGTSDTRTSSDAVDMNGDGILDVLAGNDTFLGRLGTGVGPVENVTSLGTGDGFRRRDSFDYSIGINGGFAMPIGTAKGRTIRGEIYNQSTSLGFSVGTGYSLNRSRTTHDLIDLNADGLPDLVRRTGNAIRVRYNLGRRFGTEETFGAIDPILANARIDTFRIREDSLSFLASHDDALAHDTTITQHITRSFGLFFYSTSHTTTKTAVRTTRQLADLNGDGLPDLLVKGGGCDDPDSDCDKRFHVQFNRGSDFGPPIVWPTPEWEVPLSSLGGLPDSIEITGADVLAGTGLSRGTSDSDSLSIPIPGTPVTVNANYGTNVDRDTFELALIDLDGDGAPEHVLRQEVGSGTPRVYVKRNKITGRANLLSKVHRPLGGSFTLAYSRVGNTVADPHGRLVLSRVEVDDGVDLGASFASPNLVTTMTYADGRYDRSEKEFFGFGSVTLRRADGLTIETAYENTTYALNGRVTRQTRRDSLGASFSEQRTQYDVRSTLDASEAPIGPAADCLADLHALLSTEACTPLFVVAVREDDERTEGGTFAKIHTTRDLAHDRFGNVLASIDDGDDAITTDSLYASATYQNDPSRWILGLSTSLEVRAGSATGSRLRARTGTYDAFGDLASISVDTGTGIATTTLGYDEFGNLVDVTTPPNESGESQTVHVDYEPTTRMFPTAVTDGFGYASTATYDLRFGTALVEIDTNQAQLSRTLDPFGRLVAVHGPYDTSLPGVSLSYEPTASPPRAVSVMRASAPADYTGPVPPPVTTVTFVDGSGSAIELRKTAVVNGTPGMTTTGFASHDAVGRMVTTYHPFFTAGSTTSTAFVTPIATPATHSAFDALDRVTATAHPDGAIESAIYEIAPTPDGNLFKATTIDANGHRQETFADHLERTRVFVEHPTATTSSVNRYDYLATGELSQIVDAEGTQTQLAYDLRGLRTSMANPDTGLIEDRFDLMGNRISLIEPNHRALGAQVRFLYERDRLRGVDYPSKTDVQFLYGSPGAPNFGAGRLIEVRDESGSQQHTYGAMGEVRRTLRTVTDPAPPGATKLFEFKFTTDSLGRQLRLSYPDGEQVTNSFDASGTLASVVGAGSGWTQTYADQLQYDVFGNRTRTRFGNGVISTWNFDPLRVRLATATTTLPSATRVQDVRYTYDPVGNPTRIENALPTRPNNGHLPGDTVGTFTYDGVDRLVRAVGSGSYSSNKTTTYDLQFAYSPSHNIASKQLQHLIINNGGNPQTPNDTNFSSTYTYSSRPHLPSRVGDEDLTYDPSGNLVRKQKVGTGSHRTFVWDDDGRMVQVTGQGTNQRNVYDASGVRVIRNGQGGTTVLASALYDVDQANKGQKHVFAGGARVATVLKNYSSVAAPSLPNQPGTPFYFHADHLGSSGAVTTASGTLNDAHDYFPDGQIWMASGPKEPVAGYLFNGKQFDPETGFYDFGQRHCDPRTSLWLGIDPQLTAPMSGPGTLVGRPITFSPQAFSGHNPVAAVDPDGRDFIWKRGKTYEFVPEQYGPNAGQPGLPVVADRAGAVRMQQESNAALARTGTPSASALGLGGTLAASFSNGGSAVGRTVSQAVVGAVYHTVCLLGCNEAWAPGPNVQTHPGPSTWDEVKKYSTFAASTLILGMVVKGGGGAAKSEVPHSATFTVTTAENTTRVVGNAISRPMTKAEKLLGKWLSRFAVHTEARIARTAGVRPGETLTIDGILPPCNLCKNALNKLTGSLPGSKATYTWFDEATGALKTWTSKGGSRLEQ